MRHLAAPDVSSPLRGRWLLATLVVIVLALALMGLGVWQLQRRGQRLAANAHVLERLEQPAISVTGEPLDVEAADLRRATVRGVYDYDHEIVLRNQSWNEQPGVHVLAPLKIAGVGGEEVAILVDRGWIPYDVAAPADRAVFHNAQGEVAVYGILRKTRERRGGSPVDRPPTLKNPLDSWHRVDLAKIQQQVPYTLLPLFLEEDTRPGETPRNFPMPQPDISLDEGSHLSYAIQWFSFALIGVGGYIGYYLQRTRTPARPLRQPARRTP